jgi:hypothetical protein
VKSIRQLFSIACLLIAGCESTRPASSLEEPQLKQSPYLRVGTITHFDPASATVVVRLEKRDTTLGGELVVRNNQLEVIAILKPTGLRTGNSIGMVIIRGEPSVGQEVLINNVP